jgi:hypothetical protein
LLQTGLIFVIQEADSKQIKLPDRKEITLCEAVTAVAYGKVMDSFWYGLNEEAETEGNRVRARDLIERLHNAAYAGRIKFRGIKDGDNHLDGYKDIDPLYFSQQRGLRWAVDEIWSNAPTRRFPKFEPRLPYFTMDWHHVHLDSEHFEVLLGDMGISIQQRPDADVQWERKTLRTGAAGRPTSKHLVTVEAQRRLDRADYPESLAVFSKQLAAWLKDSEPGAAPMTSKTIQNNLRELWRCRRPK